MTERAAGSIQLSNVSKSYADGAEVQTVLEHFALDMDAGEHVALCGPSGSGKSTVLNILAGIVRPDAGSVRLSVRGEEGATGVQVERLSDPESARFRRRHIGYVFQFFNLVPTLTVSENVQLPLKLNGRMDLWPRCQERLRVLRMHDRLHAFPGTLSGGERQRVAIARALAHEPDVILADEPTGNLDAQNSALVADLLFGEAQTSGTTLLVATHSADVAARADRRIDLG